MGVNKKNKYLTYRILVGLLIVNLFLINEQTF